MTEYDLAFACQLSDTAAALAESGLSTPEARRTVLYLSLLSVEIAMKAMLERAGRPVERIRKRSHDLSGLVRDLAKCRIAIAVAHGTTKLVPASRLRAVALIAANGRTTVGQILDAQAQGASKYPNQIRYGPLPRHFPPELVAQMSARVITFAETHWGSLQT